MILRADALRIPVADESVQCIVTSPPYWGLRDYGVKGQLGLEATPEEYVGRMVEVFREVHRVLRPDGTLWLNLGDCYTRGGRDSRDPGKSKMNGGERVAGLTEKGSRAPTPEGLKPKDLVGIPWRVAFALQADGWYLRQDIIWHKPNPMPEPVKDRCTRSHEYVFMFAKSKRYFYDARAIEEDSVEPNRIRDDVVGGSSWKERGQHSLGGRFRRDPESDSETTATRNRRSVWTIQTEAFPEAHFATFPQALVEPCVKAGSRPGDLVLDPFSGSGTTVMVALRLGRRAVGLELSADYIKIARRRVWGKEPLFA